MDKIARMHSDKIKLGRVFKIYSPCSDGEIWRCTLKFYSSFLVIFNSFVRVY